GTVGGGALEYYAREKCVELLEKKEHLLETYLLDEGKVMPEAKTLPMVCGGKVTLYYEYVGPKAYAYLFGAGHVSRALAEILKTIGFHITAIDDRKEVIDVFSAADVKHNLFFVDYIEKFGIPDNAFVVVSTPSHEYDYHVINKIIARRFRPKYVGMLCSPEKLADYLEKTYEEFGKDVDLHNFYSPIGLDTGGNTPEEIAVSIAAEMLAILNGKPGHRHMREVYCGKNRYW
ncbi:MAG: XdhC family protein, partial [Bacilli bacterium]|nr:XdhC family protein [Bacilli bacterium]